MHIDTIIATVLGSGVGAGIIGYLIKRSYEHALDIRIERIKEETKSAIVEQARRQSRIYDEQYEVLKLLLSLTYRLKNALQYLVTNTFSRTLNHNLTETRETFRRFQAYHDGLVELMYEERAILPDPLFEIAHEFKGSTTVLRHHLDKILASSSKESEKKLKSTYEHSTLEYKSLERGYEKLVTEIQGIIGVSHEPSRK